MFFIRNYLKLFSLAMFLYFIAEQSEFASGTDTMTSTKLPEKPPPAVPQPEPEGKGNTISIILGVVGVVVIAMFVVGVVIVYRFNRSAKKLEVESVHQDEEFLGEQNQSDKEDMKSMPRTPTSRITPDNSSKSQKSIGEKPSKKSQVAKNDKKSSEQKKGEISTNSTKSQKSIGEKPSKKSQLPKKSKKSSEQKKGQKSTKSVGSSLSNR